MRGHYHRGCNLKQYCFRYFDEWQENNLIEESGSSEKKKALLN